MREGCGLLPMAKPVSNNLFGDRRDCAHLQEGVDGRWGVLHEGHDLCLFEDRGEVRLNFVR